MDIKKLTISDVGSKMKAFAKIAGELNELLPMVDDLNNVCVLNLPTYIDNIKRKIKKMQRMTKERIPRSRSNFAAIARPKIFEMLKIRNMKSIDIFKEFVSLNLIEHGEKEYLRVRTILSEMNRKNIIEKATSGRKAAWSLILIGKQPES